MIGTVAKHTAAATLGAAKAAVVVARHAAWYVNYHVSGEARSAEPAPAKQD